MLESARTRFDPFRRRPMSAGAQEWFGGKSLFAPAFAWARPGGGTGPFRESLIGQLREAIGYAGSARRLRIRGVAGLRSRRAVRSRQRPAAAAADADVRSDHRDF